MECHDARDRLVAFQDAELSPGEVAQVEEHLRSCPTCRHRERALAASRPAPPWDLAERVPPPVLRALAEKLDPDVLLAAARRPAPIPTTGLRVATWLRREARVPMGVVVAYVVVLCAALGFGLSGLWSAADPAPRISDVQAIPADQFVPAAYDPTVLGDDPVE